MAPAILEQLDKVLEFSIPWPGYLMGKLPSRKEEAGYLLRETWCHTGCRVWGPSCQPVAVPSASFTVQDWPGPAGVDHSGGGAGMCLPCLACTGSDHFTP